MLDDYDTKQTDFNISQINKQISKLTEVETSSYL